MRKRKNKFSNLILVMIFITFALFIGYSIFSSTISLNSHTTASLSVDTKLNNSFIYLNSPNYALVVTQHPSLSTPTESMNSDKTALTQSFTISNSNNAYNTLATRITYHNYDAFNLTNGTITTTHNCGGFSAYSSTISSTTLSHNQEGTINVSMTLATKSVKSSCVVTTTITYKVGTITKTFHYYININK